MNNFTQKEIFEVIKYFGHIYTLINNNIVQKIYFVGNKFFYKKDQFFILYGELINNENNEFLKWIKGKKVTLELDYINEFKKAAIKKNLKEMIISDNEFKIIYDDRDGNEQVFLCSNIDNKNYHDIIKIVDKIETGLIYKYDLDFSNFEDNLILYIDKNNQTIQEKTVEKIIELPIKRILSHQSLSKTVKNAIGIDKDIEGVKYILSYSDRDENNKRYVSIMSISGFVKINQIFATI
jgi:hypothetical protein